MPTKDRQQNELDRFHDLNDLFCAVYEDSDYRFGELHLAEHMGPDEYPDHLIDPPEHMKGEWTYHHQIPMVLHPEKGALLLRTASLCDDDHPLSLRRHIHETHKELTNLEWKLRHRLEGLQFWSDRPIVMGVGVITRETCNDRLRPKSVDPPVVIDRNALPNFASHIDALFDYYTSPEVEPIHEWGERLIHVITTSQERLGSFIDETSLLRSYNEWDRPLDGLVKPAI